MNIRITPCLLNGDIDAVASKSMAHRLFICAALSDAPTRIKLKNLSKDIEATIACVSALGGEVSRERDMFTVSPIQTRVKKARIYDCRESGSTLRFMLPIVCALGAGGTFIGEGRLPGRPISELVAAIGGCDISADSLPITIDGRMQSGDIRIAGNVSSQYISGLLFALPLLDGDSRIILTEPLESESYVNMTMQALTAFGVAVERKEYGFSVKGGQKYRSVGECTVEGDWSNAAFFITSSAIGNLVKVNGLNDNSAQGDRVIKKLLLEFRSGGTEIDATDIPDLVPILSVAAAYSSGRTVIKNAARLRLKESDRLQAVAKNLTAVGVKVTQTHDGLIIDGRGGVTGGTVDGFNDHRIVMAAAIAATRAEGETIIIGAEAVEKSYPDFFKDFEKLGGKYDVI